MKRGNDRTFNETACCYCRRTFLYRYKYITDGLTCPYCGKDISERNDIGYIEPKKTRECESCHIGKLEVNNMSMPYEDHIIITYRCNYCPARFVEEHD